MKQRGRNESEFNKETVILAEMWVELIGEEYDEGLTLKKYRPLFMGYVSKTN